MKLQTKLTLYIGLIVFLSLSGIFFAVAHRTEKQIFHELKNSASVLLQQLILTRSWVADHGGGGVYVEKTERMKSNPYLEELGIDPDIQTADGKTFTLLNPALVVRDLSEYARKKGLVRFHMTSLNLLNPHNEPDEFERQALKKFEHHKTKEAFQADIIDGKKYFRYMAPLYTTENCLQCHAHQGYQVGDVRGGLSVFLPMEQAVIEITKSRWILFFSGILVIFFVEFMLYIFISRIVLKPISHLASAAKMLKDGNYGTPLNKESNDEIGGLTEDFNDMRETILLRTKKQQESEEKYRALSENAMDAIVTKDSSGKIILFNKAAEVMFQYERNEVIGREVAILMPERYVDQYRGALKKYIETSRGEIVGRCVEMFGLRKDKEEFPMEISVSAFETGGELHFSAIIRDLTEKKKMETSFLQAEKLSSIGGLVAGVAHELNNPLTGIMGYSELLLDNEGLDNDTKKDIMRIQIEAERSAKIVKNLLTFSREHKHEKKILGINEVIESTLNLVRHQFDLKGIELQSFLASDLESIYADDHQLQQAFINIINNASQAIEEKGTENSFLKVETKQVQGSIQISFHNNGPKITDKQMKKIFDPFFTTKDVGKGTGLGLSIVFGTIQDHHGTIEVKNHETDGVIFLIKLPVARPQDIDL